MFIAQCINIFILYFRGNPFRSGDEVSFGAEETMAVQKAFGEVICDKIRSN